MTTDGAPETTRPRWRFVGDWTFWGRVVAYGIVLLMALALALLPPKYSETLSRLPTGWIGYLKRVAPQWTWNWDLIGMAALCALGTLALGHWLVASVLQGPQDESGTIERGAASPRWRMRGSAAALGLGLLCFPIGAAFIGIFYQLEWMAGSKELLKRPIPGASDLKSIWIEIVMGIGDSSVEIQGGGEREAMEAMRAVWKKIAGAPYSRMIAPSDIRLFGLVDAEARFQGYILFVQDETNSGADRIVVDDFRLEGAGGGMRSRTELKEILERYRSELRPIQ